MSKILINTVQSLHLAINRVGRTNGSAIGTDDKAIRANSKAGGADSKAVRKGRRPIDIYATPRK